MRMLLVGGAILLPVTIVYAALHRAVTDWSSALHFVIMLDRLACEDGSNWPISLSEVLIDSTGYDELRLVRCDGAGMSRRLVLDRPRGDVISLGARWQDQGRPLLLAVDDVGAVLQGPGASVLGSLAAP